jgi:hypothetical protein
MAVMQLLMPLFEMPLHKLIHYSRVFIAYEREKSEIIAFSPIDILIIDALIL